MTAATTTVDYMDKLEQILIAHAKFSDIDPDKVPEYDVSSNGMVTKVAVETQAQFPTASAAIERARSLAAELLASDDYVAVNGADIGATIDTRPERRGGTSSQWRARVNMTLARRVDFEADRQFGYFPVSGILD